MKPEAMSSSFSRGQFLSSLASDSLQVSPPFLGAIKVLFLDALPKEVSLSSRHDFEHWDQACQLFQ